MFVTRNKWDKVFTSGLSKFFKGCLPQNLFSPFLNTLPQMFMGVMLSEIETDKFITQIFKLLTSRPGDRLLKTLSPWNITNRREKETSGQQFKVNIGKLDQEHCTCMLFYWKWRWSGQGRNIVKNIVACVKRYHNMLSVASR